MSNAINTNYVSQITTNEALVLDQGATTQVQHTEQNSQANYSATSTPKGQAIAAFSTTLTSGTATVSMTSLTGTAGQTVNGSTAGAGNTATAVQVIKISAPTGNANPITVTPASSNGYKTSGGSFIFAASQSITLAPGDEVLFKCSAAPTISSSVQGLTLTGTGSSDSLNFTIILG